MKVDPELLRSVLLYVEEHGELPEGDDQREHARVLHEDGLLAGIDAETLDEGFDLMDPRLTAEGRKLAAELRSDTLWNKANPDYSSSVETKSLRERLTD